MVFVSTAQINSIDEEELIVDTIYDTYQSNENLKYLPIPDSSYIDTLYYGNDSIQRIVHIENGEIKKKIGFYIGGQLMFESDFNNGWYHGKKVQYWLNGNKRSEYFFDNGAEIKTSKSWYENGNIQLKSVAEDTLRYVVTYYENGAKESEYYTDKYMMYKGLLKYYCDNGQLISVTNHDRLVDDRIFYHCNGEVWKKGRMKYNLIWIGNYEEYWPSGKLRIKGRYEDVKSSNEQIKNGTWEFFDEEGKLTKVEIWKWGALESEKVYD